MQNKRIPRFNLFAALLCALGLIGLFANAALAGGGVWNWKGEAATGFAYDTNVYKLSSTQSTRLDAGKSSDKISGRFKDMDSVDDFIFTPTVKATLKGPGLLGHDFVLRPSIAYSVYASNSEKNFFKFGLGLKQAIGGGGAVGLAFDYSPNIYKKNYLSGTIDSVGDGLITSSAEEVFTAAHYDKTRVTVSYGQRLWKRPGKGHANLELEKVSAHILAGYENKSYDDPFTVRSEDSVFAGFDMEFALYKHTRLDFNYLFKNIDTSVGTETLIRDEANFGVDFNGDGDAIDLSVATVQKVDRSRNTHTLGVKASTGLAEGWTGYVKYEARFASYKSEEIFDVTRLNRTDTRQKVGVGVRGKLAPRWYMNLGWVLTHNQAARDGLAVTDKAEAKSYDKNVFSALISYRF